MNVITNMFLLLRLLLHLLPFATPSISIKSTTSNSSLSRGYCTSFRHVHLSSLANASTSITISFSSHPCDIGKEYYSNDHGANLQIPPSLGAVIIGKDAHGEAHQLVMGDEPLRYSATIHPQTPTSFEYVSEYQHHVTVNDLEPGTTYYYRCIVVEHEMVNVDDSNDDYDDVEVKEDTRNLRQAALAKQDSTDFYSFRTAPTSESGTSTKVAILGDLGAFDHTKETLKVLFEHMDEIDSIVLVGDLTYANGDHRCVCICKCIMS